MGASMQPADNEGMGPVVEQDQQQPPPAPGDSRRLSWLRLRGLQQVGRDPDYRFSLANERTFLAYIRTSLALLAGAVAVVQLVPAFGVPGGRHALSLLLLLMSMSVALASYRRWWQVESALRQDRPLPAPRLPQWLTLGLLAAGLAALVLLVLSTGDVTPR